MRRPRSDPTGTTASFTSHIGRTRRLLFSLKNKSQDEEIWTLVETSFTEARADFERLLMQVTHMSLTGYDECAAGLTEWLGKLYREVRSELGLKHPANVYQKRLDTPPDSVNVTSGPDSSHSDA